MMRSITVAFTLLLIGCASAAPDSNKAPSSEPEILITQLSNVAEAARHISGGISVQYRVDITNRAKEPITIKRIDVISLGAGAYTLRPTSTPFNARLNPGESQALQFWASAFIDDPTILGANGPVTLRVTVYYDTPAGSTQSIVVQQVHASGG
ncbi:MAG TPA: hypothetical protein VKL19_07055 [Thermoanaerobaculia bacterium]|nr:hypothetical protein [Thermoanaerobaculia bacterium]